MLENNLGDLCRGKFAYAVIQEIGWGLFPIVESQHVFKAENMFVRNCENDLIYNENVQFKEIEMPEGFDEIGMIVGRDKSSWALLWTWIGKRGAIKLKLLLCLNCNDIFNLHYEIKSCRCGRTYGKHINQSHAVYHGDNAIPIEFNNKTFSDAIKSQQNNSLELSFTSIVVPKNCPSFTKDDTLSSSQNFENHKKWIFPQNTPHYFL